MLLIAAGRWCVPAVLLLLLAGRPAGATGQGHAPTAKDKCPVCGMFVAKYPDWTAALRFRDGTFVYFDGCKDLFTYYLNLKKYRPAAPPASITAIRVKDYYRLRQIDGWKALYVIGSDVNGPMGKELIPFESRADADGFMNDHKGHRVVRLQEITPALLKTLE